MPGMLDDVMDRVTRLSLQVASRVSHRDRSRISQLGLGIVVAGWKSISCASRVHIIQKRWVRDGWIPPMTTGGAAS